MASENINDTTVKPKKIGLGEFWKISKWVFGFLFQIDGKNAFWYLFLSLISAFTTISNVYILSGIFNKVTILLKNDVAQIQDIYPWIAILIGVNIFFKIITSFRNFIFRNLSLLAYTEIHRSYYNQLKQLGIQTLEQPEVNNQLQRAQDNFERLIPYFDQIVWFFRQSLSLIISLVAITRLSPLIILIIVVLSIPRFIVDKKFMAKNFALNYVTTEGRRKASANADVLSNPIKLLEISIVSAHSFFDQKFKNFRNYYEGQFTKLLEKRYKSQFFSDTLSDLSAYAGYIYIFIRYLAKTLNIGQVFFYINTVDSFENNITSTFDIASGLFESSLNLRELYAIFSLKPDFCDGNINMPQIEQGPDIEVKNLSFRYPDSEKLIFKDLSLHIKSGEKIAIVGHNGVGKTTLVKLLCRIYQPTLGCIETNGTNLEDLKIESWYQNIGVLFQDFNHYQQLTVKENIYTGKPTDPIDEKAIHSAAKNADADSFIEEYPNKFDQTLDIRFKGGIRPSTGQWQKLAIARLFYRNSPLVIFDEPTASIDAVSEYNIFNRIYTFFKGKTVIIISHRFSTVRNADRIIVLDEGKIIEEGNHEQLMKNNGYYAKAFNLQAKGYTNNNGEELNGSETG